MKFSISKCGLKITYIVSDWTSSLSGSVNRRINREWQCFHSLQQATRERIKKDYIEMIIKMEMNSASALSIPDANLYMRVDLPLDKKEYGKSGLGLRASGNTSWLASVCTAFFSSPKLPQVFLLNNNIRLWAQDFYCVIVDEGAAWVNYHTEKLGVNNPVVLV